MSTSYYFLFLLCLSSLSSWVTRDPFFCAFPPLPLSVVWPAEILGHSRKTQEQAYSKENCVMAEVNPGIVQAVRYQWRGFPNQCTWAVPLQWKKLLNALVRSYLLLLVWNVHKKKREEMKVIFLSRAGLKKVEVWGGSLSVWQIEIKCSCHKWHHSGFPLRQDTCKLLLADFLKCVSPGIHLGISNITTSDYSLYPAVQRDVTGRGCHP